MLTLELQNTYEMKTLITTLFLLTTIASFAQQKDTVTNQTIIQLTKAGLSKEIIKAKIQNSICVFDLSTDGLVALKSNGIDNDVVGAMLQKFSSPITPVAPTGIAALSSGIYINKGEQFAMIEPSVLTNVKSGGFGEVMKRALVSGLINAKTKAAIAGVESLNKISGNNPVFIFVFDTTVSAFNNSSVLGVVQSPNEFILVKLTQEKKTREVVVGKSNSVGANVGIDDKVLVSFSNKRIKKGVYEVTINSPLEPGQYCFMFASSSMYQSGMKVYDFGIK